jgi:hypothetical protein
MRKCVETLERENRSQVGLGYRLSTDSFLGLGEKQGVKPGLKISCKGLKQRKD